MSEAEKALKILRDRRAQGEDTQQAGGEFEPPTARIEEILGFARDTARKYNILPPPPFLPDFKIPTSRREENNGVVERLPKITETPKTEPEQPPQITCPRCRSSNSITGKFCAFCGWDLNQAFRVERGYNLRG